MPTTFDNLELFPGPHRIRQLRRGVQMIPTFALDGISAGTVALGPLELIIELNGRLVAATEADLWLLRDAIDALLTYPAYRGDLIEDSGREWRDISFVRFEPTGPTDRGREVSLPYTARFMQFLSDT